MLSTRNKEKKTTEIERSVVAASPHGSKLTSFLEALTNLRVTAVAAVADFYRRIQDGENDHEVTQDWKHSGYPTFEAVLRQNSVCDLGCYAAFKAAVAEFGFERVRKLGVPQTTILLGVPGDTPSLKDPSKMARAAAMADALASHKRSGGAPASPRQMQAIAQGHFVRARVEIPKPMRDEIVAALEAKITQLKRENAKLKREFAKLTQALKAAQREVERREKPGDRARTKK